MPYPLRLAWNALIYSVTGVAWAVAVGCALAAVTALTEGNSAPLSGVFLVLGILAFLIAKLVWPWRQ